MIRKPGTVLLVHLTKEDADAWSFEGAATAQRRQPGAFSLEIEICARCHSRRAQLQDYRPGEPLADSYQVALLDEGLYYPDGQILDEVYVYGSFLQSRMHQQGVTCQNCHDSHSGKLLFAGNELCNQCHLANTFDTPQQTIFTSRARAPIVWIVTCLPATTWWSTHAVITVFSSRGPISRSNSGHPMLVTDATPT